MRKLSRQVPGLVGLDPTAAERRANATTNAAEDSAPNGRNGNRIVLGSTIWNSANVPHETDTVQYHSSFGTRPGAIDQLEKRRESYVPIIADIRAVIILHD